MCVLAFMNNHRINIITTYFVLETCNCLENLYANWYANPPYATVSDSGKLGGLFPGLLHEMIIEACGSCKPYKKSQLHFDVSKIGAKTQKESEFILKNSITADTDLFFPIYGKTSREVLAPDSLFIQLVTSPGCSVVVRDEAKLAGAVDKMILGVLGVWPLLLVSYCLATVFGQLVWFFVSRILFKILVPIFIVYLFILDKSSSFNVSISTTVFSYRELVVSQIIFCMTKIYVVRDTRRKKFNCGFSVVQYCSWWINWMLVTVMGSRFIVAERSLSPAVLRLTIALINETFYHNSSSMCHVYTRNTLVYLSQAD